MSEPPALAGVSHRWVEARGLRFHVAEAGEGEVPVLLLHGWPQHWYEWREVMPRLADRHRVLALDLRGFGWSDAPPDGYEKENMASDVLAVMEALGIQGVKLVGHDWGGWIGFLLCLRAPERFERFLALSIVPPWTELRAMLPNAWRFAYQQAILAPGLGYLAHRSGRLVRTALRLGVTDGGVWDEQTLAIFAGNLAEPDRARAAVQLYRSFNLREAVPNMRGRYADSCLEVPTRLVSGAGDGVIRPSMLTGYERHALDMEVEVVLDCGHFIVDERPDLVTDRARAFLAP
jgi:pimeloyl-ACP methyl ester carboxylesterase